MTGQEIREAEIAAVNKTARSSGAVGKNAVVPRAVLDFLSKFGSKSWSILDFGSGPAMLHTYQLREAGYENTHAFDFGDNWTDSMEVQRCGEDGRYRIYRGDEPHYHLIFASNVFNTHSGPAMTMRALQLVHDSLKDGEVFFFNLPPSPNFFWKGKEKKAELFRRMSAVFGNEVRAYAGSDGQFKGKGVYYVAKYPELKMSY
jgi:SAM-dependent methyltransferase